MGLTSVFNQAGGIYYHCRAFRYGHNWLSFVRQLSEWLLEWQPTEKNLVIVGASGGYTLNKEFLSRFESIVCIEPDPLSRIIFTARFRNMRILWSEKNYLNDLVAIEHLTIDFPEHCFLFANVIGQIPLLYPDIDFGQWQKKLVLHLSKRSWASFHDRIAMRRGVAKIQSLSTYGALPVSELAERFFGKGVTVIDYLTDNLYVSDKCCYFPWYFVPDQTQIVECVRQDRNSIY